MQEWFSKLFLIKALFRPESFGSTLAFLEQQYNFCVCVFCLYMFTNSAFVGFQNNDLLDLIEYHP